MHGTVIAASILKAAKKELKRGERINSISVDVGELAPLPADELKETLSLISGWQVRTNALKAKAKCRCGFLGRPKILERGHDFCLYICSRCGNVPRVLSGKDIMIASIKIENPRNKISKLKKHKKRRS